MDIDIDMGMDMGMDIDNIDNIVDLYIERDLSLHKNLNDDKEMIKQIILSAINKLSSFPRLNDNNYEWLYYYYDNIGIYDISELRNFYRSLTYEQLNILGY